MSLLPFAVAGDGDPPIEPFGNCDAFFGAERMLPISIVASSSFLYQCDCAEDMTENWKQWKIGLNSTVCKDCDRVMFYGGVLAVFYVSPYCRIRLAILADVYCNTGCEALVMGENRDRYGCKTRENRVKGLGAMGVSLDLPPFLASLAANHGIMAANFMKMAANQVLSYATKVSFIRNRGGLSLAGSGFFIPVAATARLRRWSSAATKLQHRIPMD